MINVTPLTSASSASEYFSSDNYYSQSDALEASSWAGNGAAELGLDGHVETDAFAEVLEGRLPDGSVLNAARGDHRPGLDVTIAASKSVSLLALLTGDKRIIDAFRESSAATLRWTEKNLIEARVWNSAEQRQITEKTGNMVAATFFHDSNRNNEVHLHVHAVLANATKASDGKWHAIHNQEIFRNQHLLGTIHNAELRSRIEALGYETVPAKNPIDGSFEIKGVTRDVIDAFSTRRAEIEGALTAEGRGSAKEREIAALATRQAKATEMQPDERAAVWMTKAQEVGFDGKSLVDAALARSSAQQTVWSRIVDGVRGIGATGIAIASAMGLTSKDGDPLVPERMGHLSPKEFVAAQAVASAVRDLGEREAAFDRHQLLRTALDRGGPITIADIEARVTFLADKGLLIGNDRLMTTSGALALEQRVVGLAEEGRGKIEPIMSGSNAAFELQQAARDMGLRRLNPGQQSAGVNILQSPDRVQLIQGGAGVGKSAALMPVAKIAMDSGHNVFALAHAGRTARDFGTKLGAPASTVDSFLARHARIIDGTARPQQIERASETLSGSIIMVDEASQIGTERFGKLIDLANRMDVGKLIFAGDTRQLPAIEAGKPYALLQQEGLPTNQIIENLRATSPQMKEINAALEDLDIERAFAVLKPDTIEVPFAKGVEVAARMWVDLPKDGRENTLLLASGRAMRTDANMAVQEQLKARGELGGQSISLDVLDRVTITREGARQLTGYKDDRIVEFRTNLPSQGFERGEMGRVLGVESGRVELLMADGELKLFQPERLPRNLAHDAVSILQEKPVDIFEGDRIRWTDNDRQRGLLNGDIVHVQGIDERGVSFTDRDGNAHSFRHDDPMLRRLDLAYAVNVHIAQGMTCQNGIMLMSEHEKPLNTTQAFLVATTRIADHATLIVDNVATLERDVTHNSGEKTSALELARQSEPARQNVYDIDFGM
jgi:conjugative relaxase-like TrwC/TraI family protein